MRIFNWAERFKEQPTCDDVLKKVRKTETVYWIYVVIFILVGLHGLNTMLQAPEGNLKEHVMGLFLALFGLIQITLMKIWAHIRLAMLYQIWDSQNRLENEIRKSQAADL
ncbi:MAG: hypothetical protein ACYTFK_11405 [Planctomycetota bacterium]|jgi:hypothetical protein